MVADARSNVVAMGGLTAYLDARRAPYTQPIPYSRFPPITKRLIHQVLNIAQRAARDRG